VFEPVEKARAFERVVEQIETAIFNGTLRPGDHLPSERALVEEFQVGRSTVREALRILESMGLLKTEPGSPKGPRVSPSNTVGLQRILNGVVRVERIRLVDLVQYRMISGSAANFLAAKLRTDRHLDQMDAAVRLMESAGPEETESFARSDLRFHEVIAEAAGNSFLTIVGNVINQVIVDLVAGTIQGSARADQVRRDFISFHREIFEAIRVREGERAAELARSSLHDVYAPLLDPADAERLALLRWRRTRPPNGDTAEHDQESWGPGRLAASADGPAPGTLR
jgi:GntR family transcriptional repressor for pyruvate dehydrogenase complex